MTFQTASTRHHLAGGSKEIYPPVTPIIPMRRSRKVQIPIDDHIYALRNRIERCFNRLKNWRRLATRYDKTADSYLGFVLIAAVRLWTRVFVNKTQAT